MSAQETYCRDCGKPEHECPLFRRNGFDYCAPDFMHRFGFWPDLDYPE